MTTCVIHLDEIIKWKNDLRCVLIKCVMGSRDQPVTVISDGADKCEAVAAHCGYNLIFLLMHNEPWVTFADRSAHL